jgi:TfoX/Sxy family transcriptional regulator of competence genes
MPWVKIPAEHHPIFRAALPKDPRVETLQMFGGIAAKVNGNMFGGLFGASAMVLLADADRDEALALDGAEPFDPMGNRKVISDKVQLPVDVMDDPDALRGWLRRAFDYAVTLPKKTKGKPAAKKPAAKTKPAAKVKTAAKKPRSASKKRR